MRAELGARLSRRTAVEADLTASRDQVAAAFEAAGYDPAIVMRLSGSMEQLQTVPARSEDVNPVVAEIFEEVREVPCPPANAPAA
jgi:hypothetical protein